MLDYDKAVAVVVDTLDEILDNPFSIENAVEFGTAGSYMANLLGRIYSVDTDKTVLTVMSKLDEKRTEPKAQYCSSCGTELPANASYCCSCGNKQ